MHRDRGTLVRRFFAGAALAVAAAACATGGLFPADWRYTASAAAVTTSRAMVVTTDDFASQIGVDLLRAGGNAVDAAVAVQFALAAVNPAAGNIGGGGFMVVRLANGAAAALDFREKAPLAATRDMYLDADGNLTDRRLVGHLASGVPGSVSGMWAAHQRYGVLPWADLVEPAVDLAEGFEVTQRFYNWMEDGTVRALSAFPASAAQFLPRGG